MKNQAFTTLALCIYCLSLSSCVAISKRKFWTWSKLKSEITTTPYVAFVEINLTREKVWIPTPIIMTEINYSPNYLLDIDFHTDSINQYKSLDSIRYSISAPDNNAIQTGILPIKNGKLSIRSYSPGIYRAQCTTEPSIALGKHKQALNGTFTIYATDNSDQPKSIYINNISLDYYKPKIWSFF